MEPIVLCGTITHGRGKGHQAGFPTANLSAAHSELPAYGVYASLYLSEDAQLLTGVTNVGPRPTADQDPRPTVETWMPAFHGDVYGETACVVLLQRLRDIQKFSSMAELKRQIDEDARKASAVTAPYLLGSVLTRSAEETRALGAQLAGYLKAGDVLTLSGPLGAGKSELARGIARGLGIAGALPSPTFTILNVYQGSAFPLYHYDWYRVEDPEELVAIGAEEQLPGDGVTLVEWSEQAPELLPEDRLAVRLISLEEEQRLVCLRPLGRFRQDDSWLRELKQEYADLSA